MTENGKKTEVRLRFRINMLLAERDMTLKDLYDRVKALGAQVSSAHFYRQMKPYYSPLRLDLLTYVVRALEADPSDLFDLVEVEVEDNNQMPKAKKKSSVKPKKTNEADESEKAERARMRAKKNRDLALLGSKISVMPKSKS